MSGHRRQSGPSRETPLEKRLKEQIKRNGPISVGAYMTACLTDPEHGYYVRRQAIGAEGDFITAPEMSQVFGELIGLWAAAVWMQLGSPAPFNLVELGPGRGTLLCDALRAARVVPGFLRALALHLVESSRALRSRQALALEAFGMNPRWHDEPATLPEGAAVVIANEFLDALPVEQIVFEDGRWQWRKVGLDEDDRLAFCPGGSASLTPPLDPSAPVEPGAVYELRDVSGLLDELAGSRGGASLAMLIIDYGHTDTLMGDTLQGVRGHTYVSPFEAPGETDLTTQVDFLAVAAAARCCALSVDGPLAQAEFLGRLGIVERASKLMSANPSKAGEIEAGVARLMAPAGMGTRFKVLGVRSSDLPPLPGFET